jgi:hypothetical protein
VALVPLYLQRVAQREAQPSEGACVIDRLRQASHWTEAYQVWLNTLPRERLGDVGFVFNGSFEYAPIAGGFDWVLDTRPIRESAHAVDLVHTMGALGQRALRVVYQSDKRQSGLPVSQYLVLPAGHYQVTGAARPEGMRDGRGAQWTLRCVSEGKVQEPFARSVRFTGSNEWEPFSFEAAVPAGCPGQLLQLEPAGTGAADMFLAGTLWFDNLAVRQYH